jgi:hypothetical protein
MIQRLAAHSGAYYKDYRDQEAHTLLDRVIRVSSVGMSSDRSDASTGPEAEFEALLLRASRIERRSRTRCS